MTKADPEREMQKRLEASQAENQKLRKELAAAQAALLKEAADNKAAVDEETAARRTVERTVKERDETIRLLNRDVERWKTRDADRMARLRNLKEHLKADVIPTLEKEIQG